MYCACRAACGTLSAADTLIVIHVRRVVFNCNRAYGANLLALHTAYAADLAFFSCECALVVIFTGYRSLFSYSGKSSISPLGQVFMHFLQALQRSGSTLATPSQMLIAPYSQTFTQSP